MVAFSCGSTSSPEIQAVITLRAKPCFSMSFTTSPCNPFVSLAPALTATLIPYFARSGRAGSNASMNDASNAGPIAASGLLSVEAEVEAATFLAAAETMFASDI